MDWVLGRARRLGSLVAWLLGCLVGHHAGNGMMVVRGVWVWGGGGEELRCAD